MRLVYRKKMLENRHFLIGIFQHFTTVTDSYPSGSLLSVFGLILLIEMAHFSLAVTTWG